MTERKPDTADESSVLVRFCGGVIIGAFSVGFIALFLGPILLTAWFASFDGIKMVNDWWIFLIGGPVTIIWWFGLAAAIGWMEP